MRNEELGISIADQSCTQAPSVAILRHNKLARMICRGWRPRQPARRSNAVVAISLMPNYFVVTLCDIFQQFNGREISACRISAKQKLHRSPTHFKKRCKITSYHKMPVTASDLYPAPVHSDDLPVNVICSLSTEKTHNIRHVNRWHKLPIW